MLALETSILQFIQTKLRCSIGDAVMPTISSLGDGGAVWIVTGVACLLFPRHRGLGIAMLLALVMELVCCNIILKPLVGRVRPCERNAAIPLLVPHPHDFSFPSGHTGASFAAAAVMVFGRCHVWGAAAVVLAGLIAFSRLYLYVHYPSDVLASVVLGVFIGWIAWRMSADLQPLLG